MDFPSPRELLRRTGIAALCLLAVSLPLYLLVVGRVVRLGGLDRGDLVPWYSQWDPRFGPWTLVAILAALPLLRMVPRLLRTRGSWSFALRIGLAGTVLWGGIALSDGAKVGEARTGLVDTNGLAYPFERTAHEYIGDVGKVDDLGIRGLLRAWPTDEVQNTLAWHSRTHPPGAVLLLWTVKKTVGGGPMRAAVAVILLGALAVVVAWRWARLHLDEPGARLAALVFAAAPGTTLFFATSMEAVFTLVSVLALWAMTVGLRADSGVRGVALGLLGGAALAFATFFTWASLLVVIVVGAIEGVRLWRRRAGTSVPTAGEAGATVARERGWAGTAGALGLQVLGFALLMGAFALVGWNPIASVQAALRADAMVMPDGGGIVGWFATGVANLTAWAIAVGAATLAMLGSIQVGRIAVAERGDGDAAVEIPDLLVAAGAAALVAAFSTLFTLEVERIWILLTLPLVVGVVATLERESAGRSGTSSSGRPVHPPWTRTTFVRAWLGLLVVQSILTEVLAETRW